MLDANTMVKGLRNGHGISFSRIMIYSRWCSERTNIRANASTAAKASTLSHFMAVDLLRFDSSDDLAFRHHGATFPETFFSPFPLVSVASGCKDNPY